MHIVLQGVSDELVSTVTKAAIHEDKDEGRAAHQARHNTANGHHDVTATQYKDLENHNVTVTDHECYGHTTTCTP